MLSDNTEVQPLLSVTKLRVYVVVLVGDIGRFAPAPGTLIDAGVPPAKKSTTYGGVPAGADPADPTGVGGGTIGTGTTPTAGEGGFTGNVTPITGQGEGGG